MITAMSDMLREAGRERRAVIAFTCYDLITAQAVLDAAARRRTPVILLISAETFAARYGPALATGLLAAATSAPVPVCLQLDHESDLDAIVRAVEVGINAVMVDGSRLDYASNVALVREAVDRVRHHLVTVEAELGRVAGREDVDRPTQTGRLTDPAQATDFLQASGADCLAVSIGNVHGTSTGPVVFDWDRLGAIARAVSHPLTLHGGSGVPDPALRRAVDAGITKLNVNAALRGRWFEAMRSGLAAHADGRRLLALQADVIDDLTRFVDTVLATVGS